MKVINKQDQGGRLVYNSDIVRDIVDCTLGEVDGVVKFQENTRQARESIKVEQLESGEMYIDVYVKLNCNVEVSDVASRIQSSVKNTIENMTEFFVKTVNVHVIDVEFAEAE